MGKGGRSTRISLKMMNRRGRKPRFKCSNDQVKKLGRECVPGSIRVVGRSWGEIKTRSNNLEGGDFKIIGVRGGILEDVGFVQSLRGNSKGKTEGFNRKYDAKIDRSIQEKDRACYKSGGGRAEAGTLGWGGAGECDAFFTHIC